MSQNSDCGCDGYSLFTANTGLGTVSAANPALDGSATRVLILTAGSVGTLIKSVIVKAAMPVTTGMVRLFIVSGGGTTTLYKEIPIPTSPALNATPTPTPMLQTFEINLEGGLKLAAGYKLYATTQNAESFNVIAEGIDWAYPVERPTICCNFKQEIPVVGQGTVSTANTSLTGVGSTTIFSAPSPGSNGSVIKSITVKALQNTNLGMIRFFITDGITKFLMKEINVPETVQSGFDPSFKVVLDDCFTMKAGYAILASTQIGQSFAITIEGHSWVYA